MHKSHLIVAGIALVCACHEWNTMPLPETQSTSVLDAGAVDARVPDAMAMDAEPDTMDKPDADVKKPGNPPPPDAMPMDAEAGAADKRDAGVEMRGDPQPDADSEDGGSEDDDRGSCECTLMDEPQTMTAPCPCGFRVLRRWCTLQCKWGEWSGEDCATGAALCSPGDTGRTTIDCGGQCGERDRELRFCDPDDCRWTGWAAVQDPCAGCEAPTSLCGQPSAECSSSVPATREVPCTTCGTQMQTRSCDPATCRWSEWSNASACTWCDQCGEIVYCDTPDELAPNRGTWCRQRACTPQQAIDHCNELLLQIGCSRHEPFFLEQL